MLINLTKYESCRLLLFGLHVISISPASIAVELRLITGRGPKKIIHFFKVTDDLQTNYKVVHLCNSLPYLPVYKSTL